jgi:catechol 2,3-dioxygenase-like lactoylglutathione lyase family enzyme
MSTLAARACLLLVACLTAHAARAEPVPEPERIPVDLRRTTLLVRDMDRSLALYRDVLGLRLRYDSAGTQAAAAAPGRSRLVILCANDTFIGCVGLLRRVDLPVDAPVVRRKPAYGESYLVFNVKDLAQRFERVRAVPGVVVETAPDFVAAAPPPGQMHVIGSNIWDPDGYFVELNLMLQAPAG